MFNFIIKYKHSETVHEYIWGLIDKATDKNTGEVDYSKVLSFDMEGLEFDGQQIKGLIAGIGDEALLAGEAMHYVGQYGSVLLFILR